MKTRQETEDLFLRQEEDLSEQIRLNLMNRQLLQDIGQRFRTFVVGRTKKGDKRWPAIGRLWAAFSAFIEEDGLQRANDLELELGHTLCHLEGTCDCDAPRPPPEPARPKGTDPLVSLQDPQETAGAYMTAHPKEA